MRFVALAILWIGLAKGNQDGYMDYQDGYDDGYQDGYLDYQDTYKEYNDGYMEHKDKYLDTTLNHITKRQDYPQDPLMLPLLGTTGRMLLAAHLNTSVDAPVAVNGLFGPYSFAAFGLVQSIPETGPAPPFHLLDQTQTNAALLLTAVPSVKLGDVHDSDLRLLAERCAGFNAFNRSVYLRFAPEFNTPWYIYGNQPTAFKAIWRKLLVALHTAGATLTFAVWSPFEGSEYPFGSTGILPASPDFVALDTNHDGKIDGNDDPYAPYWPEHEFEPDWVGLTLYFRGVKQPNITDQIPGPNYVVDTITGARLPSLANFYQTYAVNRNISMMIAETGAVHHIKLDTMGVPVVQTPAGAAQELRIKSAWWRQFVTNATFLTAFPHIKMIALQESSPWVGKDAEKGTLLDFRMLGSACLETFTTDFLRVVRLYEFPARLGSIVQTWFPPNTTTSNPSLTVPTMSDSRPSETAKASGSSDQGPLSSDVVRYIMFPILGVVLVVASMWIAVTIIHRTQRTQVDAASAHEHDPDTKHEETVDDGCTIVGVRLRGSFAGDTDSAFSQFDNGGSNGFYMRHGVSFYSLHQLSAASDLDRDGRVLQRNMNRSYDRALLPHNIDADCPAPHYDDVMHASMVPPTVPLATAQPFEHVRVSIDDHTDAFLTLTMNGHPASPMADSRTSSSSTTPDAVQSR